MALKPEIAPVARKKYRPPVLTTRTLTAPVLFAQSNPCPPDLPPGSCD